MGPAGEINWAGWMEGVGPIVMPEKPTAGLRCAAVAWLILWHRPPDGTSWQARKQHTKLVKHCKQWKTWMKKQGVEIAVTTDEGDVVTITS